MKKRHISGLLAALLLAVLLCSACPAGAEEALFMDLYDFQAAAAITDAGVLPLYRQLILEAATEPGVRDMAVFLDAFLALPERDQKRMITGARLRKLLDDLDIWDAFVLAANGRLAEVEQLPFLREVIAQERALLLTGTEEWTLDAFRLYHGDVGDTGAWTFVPANPQPGAFLILKETDKDSAAQVEELADAIVTLSEGRMRRTYDPDEANAILVYSSTSSRRGNYPAYDKKVPAYAGTARLKASVLTMPEEKPYHISLSNEPPAQAELDEEQTVYYSEVPSLVDAPELVWLVEQLELMMLHPEEYRALYPAE